MARPTDRLVYYTLSTGGPLAANATRRLLRSVASLRAHNRAVPLRLYLSGPMDAATRGALDANDVTVEDLGDYQAHLATLAPPRVSEALARYPVLHKLTVLPRIGPGVARLLALDGDTFFFGDVDALFDRYADLDLYAREEPGSRACPHGYVPEHLDEDALAALAEAEGARAVAPFNIGVMLWNHGAFRALGARTEEVIRYVFRFSVWLADRGAAPEHTDLEHLRAHRGRLVEPGDDAPPLPFPSRNPWIRDEVAAWLALGKCPGLRVGRLAQGDVLQGPDMASAEGAGRISIDYFSANEERFDAWLADQGEATPPPPRAPAPIVTEAPSNRLFEDLGARLDEAWQRLDYDERAFPSLAAAALRGASLGAVSGADVLRWLLRAREIPEQDDIAATFGQPPITVYHGRRFYIHVLLWTEGMTSIHRHAFSGAFAVLEGSSLHVTYAFEARRRVSSRLVLGALRHVGTALLSPGDVTEIDHDLVHATFHLDVPSATVVVRTYRDEEVAIQHEYVPPTVAHDPFFEDPSTKRRLQALRFLRRTKQPGHAELAGDLVGRSDLHTAWVVLRDVYRDLGSASLAAPILEAARARHGAAIDDLAAALDEDLRRRKVQKVRAAVSDPSARFFLAALANLPDREAIEDLIRLRYPGADPRARIVAWLEALSGVGVIGVDLSDRLTREIVLALLDGRSEAGVFERLGEVFDPRDVERGREAIARQCARIRRTALAPLFAGRRAP